MLTRFLRRFWRASAGRSPTAERTTVAGPPPDAILSNYLTSASYIRGTRVHSSAFIPRGGELSTFQIQGLPEAEIWSLGVEYVLRPGRRLHGRADNEPAHYLAHDLELIADDDPPRHVNVVGWPSEDAEKEAQKEIALTLALSATLIRCLPPITHGIGLSRVDVVN